MESVVGFGHERPGLADDFAALARERDQLADEVNSLETSYSDLFRRYEKLRQTSIEIKQVKKYCIKRNPYVLDGTSVFAYLLFSVAYLARYILDFNTNDQSI